MPPKISTYLCKHFVHAHTSKSFAATLTRLYIFGLGYEAPLCLIIIFITLSKRRCMSSCIILLLTESRAYNPRYGSFISTVHRIIARTLNLELKIKHDMVDTKNAEAVKSEGVNKLDFHQIPCFKFVSLPN